MDTRPFIHVLSTIRHRLEPLALAYDALSANDPTDRVVAEIADRTITLADLEAVAILYQDFKDMESAAYGTHRKE